MSAPAAILAEIVGAAGRVTAVEIDPGLAQRASENLALGWPQASVIATDGFLVRSSEAADAIVVNAGVTHISLAWLDCLAAENGRLLVPLTNADRWGSFLMITRRGGGAVRYEARFASRTGIIPCVGGREEKAEARLNAALAAADFTAIKSLRRPPEEPDDSCWLAGDGWWLSTRPIGGAPAG